MILFVPSAGLGKRLRPVTEYVPKPLIKIGKNENLKNIIDINFPLCFSETILNVSHLSGKIINFIRTCRYPRMSIYREIEPIGVFGGLNNILRNRTIYEDVIIFNSDVVYEDGIEGLLQVPGDVVFGLVRGGSPDIGIDGREKISVIAGLQVTDAEPEEFFTYSGIMLIKAAALKSFSETFHERTGMISFIEFVKSALDERRSVHYFILDGQWRDIGTQPI